MVYYKGIKSSKYTCRKNKKIDKNLQKQAEELDWININFPVSVSDTGNFERRNEGTYMLMYLVMMT